MIADVLAGTRSWHVEACDVLAGLAALPPESVHCVVTSVPYYGLRDYGTGRWEGGDPDCEHKVRPTVKTGTSTLDGGKATTGHQQEGYRGACGRCGAVRVDQQIGLEESLGVYLARMVEVFREVKRVLRSDGTLWLNVGDSYAANRSYQVSDSKHKVHDFGDSNALRVPDGLKPKDLMGVPWRLAFALQADGWWLRSAITWCKLSPMPESVTDRPTSATEMVFLLSRSPRYFYDPIAVAEETTGHDQGTKGVGLWNKLPAETNNGRGASTLHTKEATRNMRNFWLLGPEPYAEAHFAVYPTEIPRRAILAGTSAHGVCGVCGAPYRRCVERTAASAGRENYAAAEVGAVDRHRGLPGRAGGFYDATSTTTGWSPGCTCDAGPPQPALVCDPFSGSGTTGVVALRLGRRYVGFDLSAQYVGLSRRRITEDAPMFNGQGELLEPPPVADGVPKQDAVGNRTYTGFNAWWKAQHAAAPEPPPEEEPAQLGLWQEAAG